MILSSGSFVWVQVNHAPGMIEKCPGGHFDLHPAKTDTKPYERSELGEVGEGLRELSRTPGAPHQVSLGSKLPSYTILAYGHQPDLIA